MSIFSLRQIKSKYWLSQPFIIQPAYITGINPGSIVANAIPAYIDIQGANFPKASSIVCCVQGEVYHLLAHFI